MTKEDPSQKHIFIQEILKKFGLDRENDLEISETKKQESTESYLK